MSRLRVGLCPTFSMWKYCQTPNLDANDCRSIRILQPTLTLCRRTPRTANARAETAGIIAGQTPSHNLRVSVTTLGYRQLWQDSDQPSRANIPRGELTEIRRCKPRHCPLLVRLLPTRCSRPGASDLSNSPRRANRVRQTGNFRTIGRQVRRGVERRYRCE